MLVAPVSNIELIKAKLAEVGLEINAEKSKPVKAADGFRYLGFDIKRGIEQTIDTALHNGDFALAEKLYETQSCDIAAETEPVIVQSQPIGSSAEPMKTEYELPNTIRNVGLVHTNETCYNGRHEDNREGL